MEPIFKIWQAWMQSSPGQQSNLRDRGAAALMQHLLLDADNYSRQQKRVWVIHVIYWNAWIWGGSLLFGRYFSKFSKFISGPRIFQKLLWVHRPLKPNPLVPPWPVHHRLSRNADLDGPISDLNRLSDYCLSQLRIRRHFRYLGDSKTGRGIHFMLAHLLYETTLNVILYCHETSHTDFQNEIIGTKAVEPFKLWSLQKIHHPQIWRKIPAYKKLTKNFVPPLPLVYLELRVSNFNWD